MKLLGTKQTISTPAAAKRESIQQRFSLLRQKRQYLTMLTLLFICVIGWTVVSIFSSQRQSKIGPEFQAAARPLNPTIDIAVLTELNSERSFTDEELSNFVIYRTILNSETKLEEVVPIDAPSSTDNSL